MAMSSLERSSQDDLTLRETADRLAIRELIDAGTHCADRRHAAGQMSLFTNDTEFFVHMDSRNVSPTHDIRGRESLRPVFDDLNQHQATTHFNGQSSLAVEQAQATGEICCLAHHVKTKGDKRTSMIASIR